MINILKQMFGGVILTILILVFFWLLGIVATFIENNPIWILPIVVLDFYLIWKEI